MYCTNEEVRGMIKDDALNVLIGNEYIDDPDERELKIAPIIAGAIADAAGEIDGYLAKRYPVPLSVVPKAINKFAKDIAIYNLFSRIGIDESEKDKNYLNRYNAAIRFFENVAKGMIDIGVSGVGNAQKASAAFSAHSSERRFSRDSMRGM
ncbi:phage protein Gp36 family protein [Paenibacillus sanguinis]|uniref:phage protein Gp36 family protein n=1 Tax=Paenibacillus sanguinis TaxID=225906 RepID=UPI0003740CA4